MSLGMQLGSSIQPLAEVSSSYYNGYVRDHIDAAVKLQSILINKDLHCTFSVTLTGLT